MCVSELVQARDRARFAGLSSAVGFSRLIEAQEIDKKIDSLVSADVVAKDGWKLRRKRERLFNEVSSLYDGADCVDRLAAGNEVLHREIIVNGEKARKAELENEAKRRLRRVASQRDNISTKNPFSAPKNAFKDKKKPNNTGYRRKRAFEIETNVLNSSKYHGVAYCLEFTVTIKAVGIDKTAARFQDAWNYFNTKYFSSAPWVHSWVMVKEITKAGEIHAHLFVLTKKAVFEPASADTPKDKTLELSRFCPVAKKWISEKWKKPVYYYRTGSGDTYNSKKEVPAGVKARLTVDGESIAGWIPQVWKTFRAGELEKYGLGVSHSLQPIKGLDDTGENSAANYAKYMSKYLVKGFADDRPEHLKNVRLVGYSQEFKRYCRAIHTDRKAEFYNGSENNGTYEKAGFRGSVIRKGNKFTKLKPDTAGNVKIEYLSGTSKKHVWSFPDYETGERREFVDYADGLKVKRRYNTLGAFSFFSPSANIQRKRRAGAAGLIGLNNLDDARRAFGSKWGYKLQKAAALYPVPFKTDKKTYIAHSIAGGIEENTSLNAVFTYQKEETGKIYQYSAAQLSRIDGLKYQDNTSGRVCVKLSHWEDRFTGARVAAGEVWDAIEYERNYIIATLRDEIGRAGYFNN